MRHGVRLGLDPGDARIGVARSDPTGFLATPVETIKVDRGGRAHWARIHAIAREVAEESGQEGLLEVVVGLPRSLRGGRENPATAKVRAWAATLARRVAPLPVRLVDERLTTVSAEAMLRDRGRKGADRRAVVDQAAAVLILQHALDTERTSGTAPGELVEGRTMEESDD
ncbi:MAG: Holliday junction resolvase RuvX [Nocardioides sp.]|uniref:Holliday junction resolvase RuvX n=1 Tax=Nocardioides sp. TaxID=35761 RepID=UPI0039E3A898